MRISSVAAAAVAFWCNVALAGNVSQGDAPTAHTLNGTIFGLHSSFYNQDFFLGVPYAQPPVNNLRYRPAQPLNSSWSGAKNATEYGYECVGYGSDTEYLGNHVSEDCLTLNVVRPSGYNGTLLPVGVWIHGGNFFEGGSADLRYNLSFIVQNAADAGTPIIGISINYRLAGWGFLYSKEIQNEGVANLGVRDQRIALHWIQENIARFGGDPSKVTIWGESAGALSVGAHLIAYGGRDDKLFRSAISQSGSPIIYKRSQDSSYYQTIYDNVTQQVNCHNATDTLQCLREVPYAILNRVLNSSAIYTETNIPIIDGDFIEEHPSLQLQAGKFVKVPYLIGTNHDEGTTLGNHGVNTTAEFLTYLNKYTTDNTSVNVLAALYPDIPEIGIPGTFHGRPGLDLGLQYKRTAAITGDYSMHAPRRLVNRVWAAHNLTSYSYLFNVLIAGVSNAIGSGHFRETPFVFDNTDGLGYPENSQPNPFAGKPQSYVDLAKLITRSWASFIYSGDPNGSGVPAATWPAYTLDNPQIFVFDANVTSYVTPDIYRAEAIAWINDNLYNVFGR